jgi:hypothetical protein
VRQFVSEWIEGGRFEIAIQRSLQKNKNDTTTKIDRSFFFFFLVLFLAERGAVRK